MAFNAHFRPYVDEGAVCIEEKGAPDDAFVGLSVHFLLTPSAPALDDFHLRIREEGHGEAILGGEVRLPLDGVGGDPHDLDTSIGEGASELGERASFLGAPWGRSLGIEEKHDGLPSKTRPAHCISLVVLNLKRIYFGTDLNHHGLLGQGAKPLGSTDHWMGLQSANKGGV